MGMGTGMVQFANGIMGMGNVTGERELVIVAKFPHNSA